MGMGTGMARTGHRVHFQFRLLLSMHKNKCTEGKEEGVTDASHGT